MKSSVYKLILFVIVFTILQSHKLCGQQVYIDMSAPVITGNNGCTASNLTWVYNSPDAAMYMTVGCNSYTSTISFTVTNPQMLNVTVYPILCMPYPGCVPDFTVNVKVDDNSIGNFMSGQSMMNYNASVTAGSHTISYTISGAATGGVSSSAYYNEVTTGVQQGVYSNLISPVSEDGIIHVEGISPDEIIITDVTGRSEVLHGNDARTSLKGILMANVLYQGQVYRQKIWVR